MDQEKIFFILTFFLIISSLVLIIYSVHVIRISHEALTPPSARVVSVYLCNGKVTITLLFNNTTPYSISIKGGNIRIVQTNQTIPVKPFTLYKIKDVNVSAPLLPCYVSYSTLGIKGLICGNVSENKVYITFYCVASIKIVTYVKVVHVSYFNGTANVTFSVFTPLNSTVNFIRCIQLANDNLSRFVAENFGEIHLNYSLPYGLHNFTITIHFPTVFYNTLEKGYTYTFFTYVNLTCHYLYKNVTKCLQVYYIFTVK
ncbi:hypothetical protein [Acidianus sp. HS-5]|uniref:hypothetical protein n=1 Tax=Acidianus sp. HS-5 TaxID=2886040 RepID=UPI001F319E0E|nr:hypothetical protein [Acidianus sp. HS-5]BDC17212.1 hypothetical protein HS5_01020 [Acidianus sp. HS-5]